MRLPKSVCYIFLAICTVLSSCATHEDTESLQRIDRARQHLRAQQYYNTLTQLKGLRPSPEQNNEFYLMRGLASFKLGDLHSALDSFEKSPQKSLQLQVYIVYLHLLLGDVAQAKKLSELLNAQDEINADIFILKANISLKEHAFQESEKYFNRALAIDELSTKAYIGLGNLYLIQREFLKAEQHYLKAIFASKNDVSPYISLIHYYIATGRFTDAQYSAELASELYPNDFNLLLLLSRVYTKMKKLDKASSILRMAVEMFPNSYGIRIKAIIQHLNSGSLEESYTGIKELLERKIDDNYISLLLGQYYLRKNKIDQAIVHFNEALAGNDNSYIVNYYLGLSHFLVGNLRLSMQLMEKAIHTYPGFIQAHLLLSTMYVYRGRYQLAAEHARVALQLEPWDLSAHLLHGIALYLLNHQKEAEYEVEVVGRLDPDNQLVKFYAALFLMANNKLDRMNLHTNGIDFKYVERIFLEIESLKLLRGNEEKFEDYSAKIAGRGGNYLSLMLIGKYYRDKNDIDKARKFFVKALEENSDSGILYYYLAEIEALRGNKQNAIAHLARGIEKDPKFIQSYQALGGLYEQLQDYQAAKRIYEEGLRQGGEDSILLNNLGWVNLMYLGNREAAYVQLRKAAALAPEDSDIHDSLAWWYYLNQDYQQAVTLLKQIVKAHAHNALYHYHLGMVYRKLGERELALDSLKKALELGIDDTYRTQIRDMLK